ncbi:hypothetical protein CHS0354_024700 [Potamilus streckersoni]|uniref:Tyrosinase copper-binding domain-containing protein n=1 Tax=Potamilus streckersoni TaxID=2493646 RepID=A0AAE0RWU9_9BIVA|nr:hypothetical protein CHS0354_024700 [Potamilus streckersoni]
MNTFKLLPLFILIDYTISQSRPPIGVEYSISKKDQEWLNNLFRFPDRPRTRKEYRMMTDEERHNFHKAFHLMRNDTSVKPNKFDLLASIHARSSTRLNGHGGPVFLPWHRVYLLLFENALREMIPLVTIPYWDTTLDAELEQPRLSYLWSSEFLGNGDGFVTTGPFAGWKTQMGELYRTVGGKRWPIHKSNLTHIFNQRHLGDINNPNISPDDSENRNFEEHHNLVHSWIGGEMAKIETSADDPVFFVLHAFIDCIWEEFRTTQKVHGIDPSLDFPVHYGDAKHSLFSPLGLGNVMTIDALSEAFARRIIYADRPTCSESSTSCDSPFFRCHRSKSVCVALTIKEVEEIRTFSTKTKRPFLEVAMEFEARFSKMTDTKEKDFLFANITDEFSGNDSHTFSNNSNGFVSDIDKLVGNNKMTDEGRMKHEMTRNIQGGTKEESFLGDQSLVKEILVPPIPLKRIVNVTDKPGLNIYLDKMRYFNMEPIFIFFVFVSFLTLLMIILKVCECFRPQMKRMTPCSSIRMHSVGRERDLITEDLDEIDKSCNTSDEKSKIYGIVNISTVKPERRNRGDHVTMTRSLSCSDRENIIHTIDHAFKGIFENDSLTDSLPSHSDEQIYREWKY